MVKNRVLKYLSVFLFLLSTFFSVEGLKAETKGTDIFSKDQIDIIKKMAIEAMLENPEVLIEVSKILKERDEIKKSKNISRLLEEYRSELFDVSDTGILGNPNGDITIVEFFDYNCSYCKVAAQNIRSLIRDDGNIKFIPREWPILNSISVFAAKAAIASIKQDKYKDFHWKLMDAKRLNEDKIISLADELDIDLIKLEDDMNGEFVKGHIEKSTLLAKKIGFSGTPLFIIEDQFIPGYVPIEEMKAIISKIRKNK